MTLYFMRRVSSGCERYWFSSTAYPLQLEAVFVPLPFLSVHVLPSIYTRSLVTRWFSLITLNMSCECQGFPEIATVFFALVIFKSLLVAHIVPVLVILSILLLLHSSSVEKLFTIPCHIERLILRSSLSLFSLFLRQFLHTLLSVSHFPLFVVR